MSIPFEVLAKQDSSTSAAVIEACKERFQWISLRRQICRTKLPRNGWIFGWVWLKMSCKFHLGARLRGRTATQHSKKGSEKLLGRVLRKVMRFTEKGFSEGVLRRGWIQKVTTTPPWRVLSYIKLWSAAYGGFRYGGGCKEIRGCLSPTQEPPPSPFWQLTRVMVWVSPGRKLGPWSEFPFLYSFTVLLNSGGSNSPWSEFWSEFPHFMGMGVVPAPSSLRRKGLFLAFSGLPRWSSDPPEKGEKRRKKAAKNQRRTNVQQLTCKIDSSNSFYYLFFSFIILELKPLVLKGKVRGEKLWKSAKKCEKVRKIMKRFCPLVFAL